MLRGGLGGRRAGGLRVSSNAADGWLSRQSDKGAAWPALGPSPGQAQAVAPAHPGEATDR